MNIHFEQAEKKSQVFFNMLVLVVVFAVFMLVWNASRTNKLHLAIYPASLGRTVYGEMNNVPVAIPAPLPPAEQVQTTTTLVPAVTPSPLPQAVAVPVPNLP